MSYETALIIKVVNEQAADTGDGLKFALRGRDAQQPPEPVVYVDGEPAASDGYTFDSGDEETAASITFDSTQAGKTVTCDYNWRLACAADRDLSVYEFGRDANTRVMKDVNGRVMAVESFEKVSGWRGLLVWDYAEQSLWDEIRRIAETPGVKFDLERGSLDAPLDRIENLFPAGYPQFREIPGVPGRTQVSLAVVQLA